MFGVIFSTTTTIVVEKGGTSLAEWLTVVGTVGATIAAVALGLGFKEWVFRPRLRFRFSSSISNQVLTGTRGGNPAAYVRLGVVNEGRQPANRVRVSVLGLERWGDNERWARVGPEMDGATLVWSNRPGEPFLDLPPRSERPLDLLAIVRDWNAQGEMPIELQIGPVVPANRADRLTPGAWRVKIEASADNASPQTSYMAFRFDGFWPGEPADGSGIWRAVVVDGPSASPQTRPPTPELRDPAEMLAEAGQRGEE